MGALAETNELDERKYLPRMPLKADTRSHSPQKMPWRLLLHIGGESHTTIGIEVKETIIMGRAVGGAIVDLDLIPYGAASCGVSRRHARFAVHEDGIFIEDLASTNGTQLNGFNLEAHRRYRLRDGDELILGNMRLVIRFIKSPL